MIYHASFYDPTMLSKSMVTKELTPCIKSLSSNNG